MLTRFLLLGHDSVTESQEAEEGLSLRVSLFHRLHQTVVIEGELWIGQTVPGEVHCLCFLQREGREGKTVQLPGYPHKYPILHLLSPLSPPPFVQKDQTPPLNHREPHVSIVPSTFSIWFYTNSCSP